LLDCSNNMKWIQFITDLLGVILRFFGVRKKEQDESNVKILKDAEVRREEIDEKVENIINHRNDFTSCRETAINMINGKDNLIARLKDFYDKITF